MATVEVKCRFCNRAKGVKKHDTGKGSHQRYRCLSCHRTFQLEYSYRACQAGIKSRNVGYGMLGKLT